MRKRAAFGVAILGLGSAPAFACGHCDEDKIAAVYDHSAIAKAHAKHHEVAFFAIEGPLPASAEPRRSIERALRSLEGVDAHSLRVAKDAGSLALSYDGSRTSSARIMDALNRTQALAGVSFFGLNAAR